MSGDDEADRRLVAERGDDPIELDSGQAEDHPDSFAVERLGDRLASRHPCHDSALSA